jgi:beta-glucan synthesis-associated protein KRE6
VKWFTDNEFVYGIRGESLQIMRSMIPREPMYLIMNTAVSKNWGFPAPCPDGCTCDCFECDNPLCECAIPSGYCNNLPANFEIDYVRVYQAANDTNHILGCSPVDRPTEIFIEGHLKRYMAEGQTRPLQPVVSGGGACSSNLHCGGQTNGVCASGNCACNNAWTGPHCLSHAGFYDVDTNAPIPKFSCK